MALAPYCTTLNTPESRARTFDTTSSLYERCKISEAIVKSEVRAGRRLDKLISVGHRTNISSYLLASLIEPHRLLTIAPRLTNISNAVLVGWNGLRFSALIMHNKKGSNVVARHEEGN